MHRFQMGHLEAQNTSSTSQEETQEESLIYKAVSNPAPGNKLIVIRLFH